MSRVAAGVTLFLVFFVHVAASENLEAPADDCTHCNIFRNIPKNDFANEKNFSKEERDHRDLCLKSCPHLFQEEAEGNIPEEVQNHKTNAPAEDGYRLKSENNRSLRPVKSILSMIAYWLYSAAVFFSVIIHCAVSNTVVVFENTLDLPPGILGMRRCDRLDLVRMGVSSAYVNILKSVARFFVPRRRGEVTENNLRKDPFLSELDRELLETSSVAPRLQRRAVKRLMRKN